MSEKELNMHALAFGSLMGNILSLEFMLRLFLLNASSDPEVSFPESDKLHQLKEGETITLNEFTRHRFFSDVVKHYNRDSRIQEKGLTIDNTLVDIRNALAHGIVWGKNPLPPLRLLHFQNEKDTVSVKLNSLLTIEWFNQNIRRVRIAMESVEKAIELLNIGEL